MGIVGRRTFLITRITAQNRVSISVIEQIVWGAEPTVESVGAILKVIVIQLSVSFLLLRINEILRCFGCQYTAVVLEIRETGEF